MGNPRCQWVRDRLPLLAGEELRGLDLRRVERHLIGCLKCREHRASLDQALGVLHAVSAYSPAQPDARPLWPDLARQIRESRRPAQTPLFTWPQRLGLGLRFWPAFGLSVALVAAVIAAGSRQPVASPGTRVTINTVPPPPALAPAVVSAPAEAIEASRETTSKPQGEMTSAESVPATRLGYDLDHAMPMGVEGREGKPQPTF